MDNKKFLLISVIASSIAGFLGGGVVKILYIIYDLPIWVNTTSAFDVFIMLGVSCVFVSGMVYVFRLFWTGELNKHPFYYKIQAFFGILMLLLFFSVFALGVYREIERILALF